MWKKRRLKNSYLLDRRPKKSFLGKKPSIEKITPERRPKNSFRRRSKKPLPIVDRNIPSPRRSKYTIPIVGRKRFSRHLVSKVRIFATLKWRINATFSASDCDVRPTRPTQLRSFVNKTSLRIPHNISRAWKNDIFNKFKPLTLNYVAKTGAYYWTKCLTGKTHWK